MSPKVTAKVTTNAARQVGVGRYLMDDLLSVILFIALYRRCNGQQVQL
jgi:hypothetical protein